MSELVFQAEYKDGIEFYVSDDGDTTGMSIRGVSRCSGVDHKAIINLISTKDVVNSVGHNLLKPFAGKIFIPVNNPVENNAKLIKSDVCAAIITYYAYESKSAKNDTAKTTLKKFMAIGIDNWIKEAVGYIEEDHIDQRKLSETLSLILQEVQIVRKANDDLRPLAINYIKVKDGVRAQFPGLDNILDSIEDEKTPKLLPGTKVTLSDWVRSKKINLNNGGYCALGRMVSECYKTMKREEPKKGNRKKSNGKWSMNVRLYGEQDFPILESALKQYMRTAV